MQRHEVVAAMTRAGLENPRAVVFKARDGKTWLDLYAGSKESRKTVRVSANPTPDDVTTAVEELKT